MPKTPKPKPSANAQKAATFRGEVKDPRTGKVHNVKRVAQDVDHMNKNQARITSPDAPSLDTNSPNSLEGRVIQKLKVFKDKITGHEHASIDLIEKSGAKIDRHDLAKIFTEEIERLKVEPWSEGQEATIKMLNKYIKGNPKEGLPGLLQFNKKGVNIPLEGDDVFFDGVKLRAWLRRFRQDSGRMYVPGKDLSLEELTAKQVAANVNKMLKTTMDAQDPAIAKSYNDLMALYARRMKTWGHLKKELAIQDMGEAGLAPTRKNWFKSKFAKPLQDWEFGQRGLDTDIDVSVWDDFGKGVGEDFLTEVKDQLVYGRLFPEEALGLQGGTWEAATARGGQAVAKMAQGRLPSAGMEAVRGVAESADMVKNSIFRKMVMEGQAPVAAGAYEAAGSALKGVANVAKGTAKAVGAAGEFAADVAAPLGTTARMVERVGTEGARAAAITMPIINKMGKYRQTLREADARGGNALGATHYMLSQQDPEYKKLYQEQAKKEDERRQ